MATRPPLPIHLAASSRASRWGASGSTNTRRINTGGGGWVLSMRGAGARARSYVLGVSCSVVGIAPRFVPAGSGPAPARGMPVRVPSESDLHARIVRHMDAVDESDLMRLILHDHRTSTDAVSEE